MNRVLITGANGQLGQCFKALEPQSDLHITFATRAALDITDPDAIDVFLSDNSFDYLINAAAYTAVDKAEQEEDQARLINATASRFLAKACKKHNVHLVHISTDFVFDGTKTSPYLITDQKNPQSVYGKTKSEGEEHIIENGGSYSIIRASWLYSNFATNFYKTIIRLAQTKEVISVVNDHIGVPDSAEELAKQLLSLITNNTLPNGILHFAHSGSCSWMEFAKKIVELKNLDLGINPISTEAYGAPAPRPAYSIMQQSPCFTEVHWVKALKDVVLGLKH